MKNWIEQTHFAGLDWADDHHDVVVVDRQGQTQLRLEFAHSAAGWQELRQALAPWPGIPVAIETNQGLAVDQLLQWEFTVYPVVPKAAAAYRTRQCPSGLKDDFHDAWSLAQALRTDGQRWRPWQPLDPLTAQLRLLCRDEVALIEQRTALVNQLKAALKEFYPAALEAFSDWTHPSAWAFVLAFPTPQDLQQAGRRKWEKFLHTHRLWRSDTAPERLALFAQATAFVGSAAVTAAKSCLALALARLLVTLEAQLKLYRARIAQLFAQHPDHDLFGSLPGAGPKLAPRLLSQLAGVDWTSLAQVRGWAGTAPITFQSGQMRRVKVRWACNHFLRATLHLWANLSRHSCAWAQAFYERHRQQGQSHACALRALANRWLNVIAGMCRSGTAYNPELHLRNLQKHGSWVLALSPHPTPKKPSDPPPRPVNNSHEKSLSSTENFCGQGRRGQAAAVLAEPAAG